MALKRTPRPRDPVQLGKLMVDIMIGAVPDAVDDGKNEAAADLGQRGGKARAASLSKEERAKIAHAGAKARWAKKADPSEVG